MPRTEGQYRALSFFFDGVPRPGEKKETAATKKKEGGTNGETQKKSYSVHGPYAAKICDGCHDRVTNALVAPIQELCFRCHEFRLDKKWIHGPLAVGGCKVCHDPHSSGFRFLLVSEAERFCFYCHDEKMIARNEAHRDTTLQCTSCHNAHMSDRQYLLREDIRS